MPTRGEVRRAIYWQDYLALPRRERLKVPPPRCVTCGVDPVALNRGEPLFVCRHEPLTIDAATLERGRKELKPESESV